MKKFIGRLVSVLLCTVCITGTYTGLIYADSSTAASGYISENVLEFLGAEDFENLAEAGVIAENSENISVKSAENSNVGISSVKTYDNKYIIITFDAGFDNIDISDITLKKYSDNWYTLKPKTTNIQVVDCVCTLNDSGQSVVIYKVTDDIDGTRIKHIKEGSNFDDLESAVAIADNYLTWQMDHGGWDKGVDEQAERAWDGVEKKNVFSGWNASNGTPCGTIDNDATYTQMEHIAAVYREVKDPKYKESVEKGLEFIFNLQYESGGLAQVYPKRGNYSDYVTFNDNAMINTLIMLENMEEGNYPFDSDIISDEYREKISAALDKATDYILKSQIESQGKLTGWCAQHDPVTYEPRGGRAYELPSISGSESIPVLKFLMNRKEQTDEIKNAVESAIQYFRESEVKGYRFDAYDPNGVYFIEDESSSLWYRFYEIGTNLPIFCDRDGVIKHDITEIGEERRTGYAWTGNWPKALIDVYDSVGYYPNKITAVVTGTNSQTYDGKTLNINDSADVFEEITASSSDSLFTINKSQGMITSYNGNGTKIKIPSEISGTAITVLGDYVFKNPSVIKEIFVPDSISSISENAFEGCDNAVIYCNTGSAAEKYAERNNLKYAVLGDTNGDKKITASDSALLFKYLIDMDEGLFGEYGKRAAEYIDSELSTVTAAKILEKVRKMDYEF